MRPVHPEDAERYEALFMQKVQRDSSSGCWIWTGARSWAGYGVFAVRYGRRDGRRATTRTWPAHRWAYAFFTKPIPRGRHVYHLCANRACVNPDHLAVVMPTRNAATQRRKYPPAVALGRKGGQARARALSPAQRVAIAQDAARIRWQRYRSRLEADDEWIVIEAG